MHIQFGSFGINVKHFKYSKYLHFLCFELNFISNINYLPNKV